MSIDAVWLPEQDGTVGAVETAWARAFLDALESHRAGVYVNFLDSDDEMDPNHVECLLICAEETGADYVYPWFRVKGGADPFPQFFGKPWDNDQPHQTTVVTMVRTELAQRVGFNHESKRQVA